MNWTRNSRLGCKDRLDGLGQMSVRRAPLCLCGAVHEFAGSSRDAGRRIEGKSRLVKVPLSRLLLSAQICRIFHLGWCWLPHSTLNPRKYLKHPGPNISHPSCWTAKKAHKDATLADTDGSAAHSRVMYVLFSSLRRPPHFRKISSSLSPVFATVSSRRFSIVCRGIRGTQVRHSVP